MESDPQKKKKKKILTTQVLSFYNKKFIVDKFYLEKKL